MTILSPIEGILLVDKPVGRTSFSLVAALRKILGVKKIGHAGTLDPFATGVMVLLIGRNFTRLSDILLTKDKEYLATLHLGIETDTMDCEGQILSTNPLEPTLEQIQLSIQKFQGDIEQIPPMFSAKKINGKKLYELARQGKSVERKPAQVHVNIEILSYTYPELILRVACSKGTYIRALASDIGKDLGCGAHLTQLRRTQSGTFHIDQCLDGNLLKFDPLTDPERATIISSLKSFT